MSEETPQFPTYNLFFKIKNRCISQTSRFSGSVCRASPGRRQPPAPRAPPAGVHGLRTQSRSRKGDASFQRESVFPASKGHPGGHALRATGPQVRQVFLFSSCLLPVAPHLPWAPTCRAPAPGLPSEPSACAVGGRPGGRHSVLPSCKARSAQLLPDPLGHGHQRPAGCASMEKSVPATKPPKSSKMAARTVPGLL